MKRFVLLAALLFAAVALAGNESVVYDTLSKGSQVAVVSSSTLDLSTTQPAEIPFGAARRPNLTVAAAIASASATVKVTVVRYSKAPDGSVQYWSAISNTFAADSTVTFNGSFVSDSWAVDTAGYEFGKIYVTAISAGGATITWSVH